jgi:2-keto-4-pentenoate hydratase/2-oxohepta-3-ene-1,7-dioic acid hydratase in catechol pathway
MKLATCVYGDRKFLGAVITEKGIVIDLEERAKRMGVPKLERSVLWNMGALLEAEHGLELAAEIIERCAKIRVAPCLSKVRFLAPVECPGKLFCLAGNYQEHIEESNGEMCEQDKTTPRFFIKPSSNTVVGDGDAIIIPAVGRAIDWEGELAVVIGREAKRVLADEAMKHVAGYTIMNDVSERKLKIWERGESRPKDEWFDWLNGKWCDTFAPMGPWLVTTEEITDPHALTISTYVNDERKQNCSTADMLIKIPKLIEYISSIVTLSPGDVISTGTVAGVGMTTGNFLKAGDKVKIAISSIGELRSRVV